MAPGTYDELPRFKGAGFPSMLVHWWRLTRLTVEMAALGSVTVTYRDAAWLCGRHRGLGAFAARFVPAIEM